MTLDPHFKAMLDAQAAAAAEAPPPLTQIPPDMVRAGYRAQRTSQNVASTVASVAARDLEVGGAAGPRPARIYTPAEAATQSGLLVYFHGGGFVIGDLETHDAHCRRLAHFSGQRVMAVDYRLAPENPFPAGHDDALAATRWAFDHAAELGADPARIGVGGDSAGGNLAASVAQDLRGDPGRRLKLQLLLYPATWPAAGNAVAPRARRAGALEGRDGLLRALAGFRRPRAGAPRHAGPAPPTSRACRAPMWSPPASIRWSTRAATTPLRWPPPASTRPT